MCCSGDQVSAYLPGGPLPDGWCSESWSPADCCDDLKATDTLLQVKAALGNPAFLVSWVNTSRPCASPGWEWVECDWKGRVARLNFSNMGLAGPLPQDLVVGVYGLEVLDLSYNSFTGPLPDLLYHAPDQTTSWLHNNRHLRVLDLSHNLLTGPLPLYWDQMSALQAIDLSYNTFQVGIGTLCSGPLYWCQLRVPHLLYGAVTPSTEQAVPHAVWYMTRHHHVFAKPLPQAIMASRLVVDLFPSPTAVRSAWRHPDPLG